MTKSIMINIFFVEIYS